MSEVKKKKKVKFIDLKDLRDYKNLDKEFKPLHWLFIGPKIILACTTAARKSEKSRITEWERKSAKTGKEESTNPEASYCQTIIR